MCENNGKTIAAMLVAEAGLGNAVALTPERVKLLADFLIRLEKDAARLEKLRKIMGYAQKGTDRIVRIYEVILQADSLSKQRQSSAGGSVTQAIDAFVLPAGYLDIEKVD